ncbi:MAG TPA: putative DNA modification/repair radical SAM protein [Lacipirellulaceae bacterium]|nr:putative DNA modification/repair radical SAM protein [Lacipirellulaceae bacterium]
MDLNTKLHILADAAKYDTACASSGSERKRTSGGIGNAAPAGICHSFTPDGRCVSLLKILLTNYCIFDCKYCINRVSSDVPRARFTPEEVVRLTLDFYRRNYIEGLFLSSGIIQNADYTMEQLATVARLLRTEHKFGGYIHLKTIPGAAEPLVAEAGRWADRVSVNIELPTEADLVQLAPEKRAGDIEQSMAEVRSRIDARRDEQSAGLKPPSFAPAGQSTQMIVGATPTPDALILGAASRLYQRHRLRRVYYSAYSPIPHSDGRLPPLQPPLVREHRLYQADWLMRFYGFGVDEIVTPEQPNLDLEIDPKLSWALAHRDQFPVDVNAAPRELLLRIPGLGVRTVNRIVATRRVRSLTAADLRKLRVAWNRAKFFVATLDHRPRPRDLESEFLRSRFLASQPRQLHLFDLAQSAHSGEV